MVNKGNHPQMALIQVSEILQFTQVLLNGCPCARILMSLPTWTWWGNDSARRRQRQSPAATRRTDEGNRLGSWETMRNLNSLDISRFSFRLGEDTAFFGLYVNTSPLTLPRKHRFTLLTLLGSVDLRDKCCEAMWICCVPGSEDSEDGTDHPGDVEQPPGSEDYELLDSSFTCEQC